MVLRLRGEHGRHFLKCPGLPPLLWQERFNLLELCRPLVPLGIAVHDMLSFDYIPPKVADGMILRILRFQRSILRAYRSRFYSTWVKGPLGFPIV